MRAAKPFQPGLTVAELVVVIAVIVALALVTAPRNMCRPQKGVVVMATSNARQMALGLSEFESEYGRYPDRSTVQKIVDATGTKMNLHGDSSNAYFRQLIAAEIVKSEMPFYAKTPYTKIPDDDYSGDRALSKGEVGYGYIMDGDVALGNGTPGRPIVVTPLLDGHPDGRFDPEPFKGKAVVLFVDSSVKQLNIRPSDKLAVLGGGKTLLETGEDTVWGTKIKPVIKPPEK